MCVGRRRYYTLLQKNKQVPQERFLTFTSKCMYGEFKDGDQDVAPVSGGAIRSQFRQRNLLLLQLETQREAMAKQLELVNEQINLIKKKKTTYSEQVQSYYKEYKNKSAELEKMKRQTPVNFLTDGKIIKGYNNDGKLVAVYDRYKIMP